MEKSNPVKDVFLANKPEFLEIFGFTDCWFDETTDIYHCTFQPTTALTHSNGTIVQGGFVAGMLDSAMAQYILYTHNFTMNPLTLKMDVTYLLSCRPGMVEVQSKVLKMGKSIAFTTAELFQDNQLIATASATNKLVLIQH
jgi:acyl-coenzyme A thioesterase PaaI-like protein